MTQYALIAENRVHQIENQPFAVSAPFTWQEIPAGQDVTTDWSFVDGAFVAPEPVSQEEHWATLRAERDNRLAASDKYAMSDYPHVDDATQQAWLTYRQALRDLPDNTTDPGSPVWPVAPNEESER